MTSSRLVRPRPETPGIAELVRRAESGHLRIPEFQRSFVWKATDVRKLADSIWRGYPIGSLLLWRRPSEAGVASFGPVSFDVDASADATWVVDGQQRIATLIGLFSPQVQDRPNIFDVYFDLHSQEVVGGRATGVPRWWLPLSEALDGRRVLAWLRASDADLDDEDSELALEFSAALNEYKLLAYVVDEADIDVLRDVFDRVNSSGRPIQRADVFHALFSVDSEPGSLDSVAKALSRTGWGTVPRQRVLQSLLAVRGGDVQRNERDEFRDGPLPAEAYDATERALDRAISFLRGQGLPHLGLLPQEFPIPVLAAFFHVHARPDAYTERLLGRWLWRGFVFGFTPSGQTPALRRAIQAVNPVRNQPAEAPSEYDAVAELLDQVPDGAPFSPRSTKFRYSDRWTRLALVALANQDPRGGDGKRIPVAEEIDRDGWKAVGQYVAKHRSHLGNRGFWPRDGGHLTGTEVEEVLESHCVPSEAARFLREGDVDGFLDARAQRLFDTTERFLIPKVDSGAPTRPSINALVLGDSDEDVTENVPTSVD